LDNQLNVIFDESDGRTQIRSDAPQRELTQQDETDNEALTNASTRQPSQNADETTNLLDADQLVERYKRTFAQQERFVQSVVETAAAIQKYSASICSSDGFDVALLKAVLRKSCLEAIALAQQNGMLVLNNDSVRFPDPLLLATAYSMIPESKRPVLHLKIGRRLWKEYKDSSIDNDSAPWCICKPVGKRRARLTLPRRRVSLNKGLLLWERTRGAPRCTKCRSSCTMPVPKLCIALETLSIWMRSWMPCSVTHNPFVTKYNPTIRWSMPMALGTG
jgi:hypothetical protein